MLPHTSPQKMRKRREAKKSGILKNLAEHKVNLMPMGDSCCSWWTTPAARIIFYLFFLKFLLCILATLNAMPAKPIKNRRCGSLDATWMQHGNDLLGCSEINDKRVVFNYTHDNSLYFCFSQCLRFLHFFLFLASFYLTYGTRCMPQFVDSLAAVSWVSFSNNFKFAQSCLTLRKHATKGIFPAIFLFLLFHCCLAQATTMKRKSFDAAGISPQPKTIDWTTVSFFVLWYIFVQFILRFSCFIVNESPSIFHGC